RSRRRSGAAPRRRRVLARRGGGRVARPLRARRRHGGGAPFRQRGAGPRRRPDRRRGPLRSERILGSTRSRPRPRAPAGRGRAGLDEVVLAALASLGPGAAGVDVDVPETLPPVEADPALLERAVANVIENAVRWSPPDQRVRVEAGAFDGHLDLRVVDRGPGI